LSLFGRIGERLKTYGQLISRIGTWPLLLVWWGRCGQVFTVNMASRLSHWSPAGLRVADLPCGAPQCDFSTFWPAGLLAAQGNAAAAYQPAALQALRENLFFPQIDMVPFLYPPPTLLAVIPLSCLPFETGFWAWSLILTVLAAGLLRAAGLSWAIILLTFISPAALWNDQIGQLGTFTGAALVAGLLLSVTRPRLAGMILAILVIKPQAALLAPLALLAGPRPRRGLAAAASTGATLLILSLLFLGQGAWRAYLGPGLAASNVILQAPLGSGDDYHQFGISVFWMMRAVGAGIAASYAAQAIAAIAAAALVLLLWRGKAGIHAKVAITVFLSLLATPYGFVGDMVAYSTALLLLAQGRGWRIDILDACLWLWPALNPAIHAGCGLLLTPFVVTFAAARAWPRETRRRPSRPAMLVTRRSA
jgi:hypothetical protein